MRREVAPLSLFGLGYVRNRIGACVLVPYL